MRKKLLILFLVISLFVITAPAHAKKGSGNPHPGDSPEWGHQTRR